MTLIDHAQAELDRVIAATPAEVGICAVRIPRAGFSRRFPIL